MAEEKRFKRERTGDDSVSDPISQKVDAIVGSKMPESQKEAYLRQLGVIKTSEKEGVPFEVYAKVKKIEQGRIRAMAAFPKATKVRLATLKEWDEIFKDF